MTGNNHIPLGIHDEGRRDIGQLRTIRQINVLTPLHTRHISLVMLQIFLARLLRPVAAKENQTHAVIFSDILHALEQLNFKRTKYSVFDSAAGYS